MGVVGLVVTEAALRTTKLESFMRVGQIRAGAKLQRPASGRQEISDYD